MGCTVGYVHGRELVATQPARGNYRGRPSVDARVHLVLENQVTCNEELVVGTIKNPAFGALKTHLHTGSLRLVPTKLGLALLQGKRRISFANSICEYRVGPSVRGWGRPHTTPPAKGRNLIAEGQTVSLVYIVALWMLGSKTETMILVNMTVNNN